MDGAQGLCWGGWLPHPVPSGDASPHSLPGRWVPRRMQIHIEKENYGHNPCISENEVE